MKKQLIWAFEWRKSVHYWWSYILFSPECKELTSMLDPLLYRRGVPPVVIRCVHWTMQMGVLQTWIKAQGIAVVMMNIRPTPNASMKGPQPCTHHSHLPIWHPLIKPDQLDPLIKIYMKTNALSTIFTRYGKPNMDEPSKYRYPKVNMDIRNWIIDL